MISFSQKVGGPERSTASFRDPAGFVVNVHDKVYRVLTTKGQDDYTALMGSGLYDVLVSDGLLIPHEEVDGIKGYDTPNDTYKILLPAQIPLISYPYEWSFSQLKDAALLTLSAQKKALENGLSLKDASAYNVQFLNGKPILIDTLSFEPYNGQKVWVAYQQFCQHFLAPLALMASIDVRINQLLRNYIDGIPLDLAAKLLPARKKLRSGLLLHLVWHNAAGKSKGSPTAAAQQIKAQASPTNKRALLGLADSLERAIKGLKLSKKIQTVWGEYYDDTNYTDSAFKHKKQLISEFIQRVKPPIVWDLGGNDGTFSKVALEAGAREVVCFDIDPLAVEKSYQMVKKEKLSTLLPLLADLTNPSPGIGWANAERSSLAERAGDNNTVMALALVHHLAIANNLPFELIASYFARLGEHLIIEFIPKTDSKVQILLSTRVDIFTNYDQDSFEEAFSTHYKIVDQKAVQDSQRTMYLMQRR